MSNLNLQVLCLYCFVNVSGKSEVISSIIHEETRLYWHSIKQSFFKRHADEVYFQLLYIELLLIGLTANFTTFYIKATGMSAVLFRSFLTLLM